MTKDAEKVIRVLESKGIKVVVNNVDFRTDKRALEVKGFAREFGWDREQIKQYLGWRGVLVGDDCLDWMLEKESK